MAIKCKTHGAYTGEWKPACYQGVRGGQYDNRACQTCWAIFLGMCERCMNCGCHIAEDEESEDDGQN